MKFSIFLTIRIILLRLKKLMDAVESIKSYIRFEVFVRMKFIFYFFLNSRTIIPSFFIASFLRLKRYIAGLSKRIYSPVISNDRCSQYFCITYSLRLNAIQQAKNLEHSCNRNSDKVAQIFEAPRKSKQLIDSFLSRLETLSSIRGTYTKVRTNLKFVLTFQYSISLLRNL